MSVKPKDTVRNPSNTLLNSFFSRQRRELKSAVQTPDPVVLNTATVTIDPQLHESKTLVLDKADGVVVTLPNAVGSGAKYRFVVRTSASGGTYDILCGRNTDFMQGNAILFADGGDTVVGFAANPAASDSIRLDGSTQGGLAGCEVVLEDIAANRWQALVIGDASSTESTPFESLVS